MQIRKQSWGIAALFLIVFCCLGFAAVNFGALFKGIEGFEINLPTATRFAVAYGPIAFPILGVVAATAFILSGVRGRSRWGQWFLAAIFALLIVWAVRGLFTGGSFMGPTIRAPR
jgi:hypothetical protein